MMIYSVNGKEIVTLLDEKRLAGESRIGFEASNLEPGIYFYHLILHQTVTFYEFIIGYI